MVAQGSGDDTFAAKLLAGDRVTLGRAVNAVENDDAGAADVLRAMHGHLGRAHVVGITGAPGAGKSTLVNALIHEFRNSGKTVGVVAVDPSSPLTGGAILGDRIRMSDHSSDRDVFIRSVASRGHLGGLSRTAVRVIDVMDAAGKDIIIVETVGTGQSEVEVMQAAQTVIVVCAPGLGDEIQAVKAGILEIADILVVNRGDNPLANRTERDLLEAAVFTRDDGWRVPVRRTTATTGEGVVELAETIGAHNEHLGPERLATGAMQRSASLVSSAAKELMERRLRSADSEEMQALAAALLSGEIDLETAASRALKLVSRSG